MKDDKGWPREYRPSAFWRTALILCGLALVSGGLVGGWTLATANSPDSSHFGRFWMVGICIIFAALGFYGLLWTLQHRIVLFADRIEIEELLHTTVLNREEIRGWRSLNTTPPSFAFVLKDPSRRSVKMANVFNIDPELAKWIYMLPCLDSEDRRRTKQEIRNNLNFGKSYGDRMRTLVKGKRTAKILAWVTSLSCIWQFIYHDPPCWHLPP